MRKKNIYLLNYFKGSKVWNNFAIRPPSTHTPLFNDVAQDGLELTVCKPQITLPALGYDVAQAGTHDAPASVFQCGILR